MKNPQMLEENPEELAEENPEFQENRKERKIWVKLIVLIGILCFAIVTMLKLRGGKVLQKLKDMVNAETTETVNATEKNQSILDMLEAAEQENTDISAVLENTENSEDIGSIENMESAVKVNTSADTAVQQPVYIEPVKIADTYAEAGIGKHTIFLQKAGNQ